jgi:arsenite methyltransferase
VKPDYGIDAPGVIRNLLIAGGTALLVALLALVGVLPAEPRLGLGGADIGIRLIPSLLPAAAGFLGAALWMVLGSRFSKVREREAFLDRLPWRGDEQVLDVGCGRGLLLVGAARRLGTGQAVGIDLWQAEDLSGNRPQAPLDNAALEGVRDRVAVQTADMRRMPFTDASFDVVVSRAAIHNLYAAPDRAAAVMEIARVLKPGGRALIADIRHTRDYARTFAAHGCREVRLLDSRLVSALCALVTFGSLRPNTLLARKDSGGAFAG